MPKWRPKSMTNRWNFRTCDFLFFAKCITLKSFFYMIRGTRNLEKIDKKSMQIRCSKKGCKKHEQCLKFESEWKPESIKSLSKKMSENRCEKGARLCNGQEGRRVRRDAPSNVLTSQNVSSSSCKRLLNVWTSLRFAFLTPLRYTHRLETSPDVNL